MNTKTSKYDDFQYINNSFQNYIKRRSTHPLHFLNFCSTKEEQEFLMELSEIIKKQNPHFTYKHIYIAIIYIYYGLILNEQPEDYLDNNIIKYITSNYSNINKLIYEIVSSEQDYAVIIRRSFFQMELNY